MFVLAFKLTLTIAWIGAVLLVAGVVTLPIHDPINGPANPRLKAAGNRVICTGVALFAVAIALSILLAVCCLWMN